MFLFLLPANDFADNDPSNFPPDRYRPYLRKSAVSGDYELYYSVEYEKRSGTTDISRGRKIRRHLYNNIYWKIWYPRYGAISTDSKKKFYTLFTPFTYVCMYSFMH